MRNIDKINLDMNEIPLQPNGFANIMANITRTGVFIYHRIQPDGTVEVIRQLRHPDHVFAEESLETLKGLPITNEHPNDLISPESKDLVVGMTTNTPKRISLDEKPEEYIQQELTFMDGEAIELIRSNKKRELSLGYTCELKDEAGEYNGEKFTHIQTDIKYNHLSLVERGRAGAKCSVILDNINSEGTVFDGLSFLNNTIGLEKLEMKTFIKDGSEFEVSEELHEVLDSMNSKIEGLTNELADTEKLKAELDELKTTIAENKDSVVVMKDEIEKAVKAKIGVISKAVKVCNDEADFSEMSVRDIQAKVIGELRPSTNLDGKSDEYVSARFDMCLEDYKPSKNEAIIADSKTTSTVVTEDSLKAERWERAKSQHKNLERFRI